MTHSLGFSIAAAALVAAGSSTALGQSPAAQTQEPNRPSAPAAAGEATLGDRGHEPPGTIFSTLSLFGDRLADVTKPTFVVTPKLSGVETTCIGCRGFETTVVRPDATSSTTPWILQGRWRRQTPLGAVSTGFLGARNYALPLFTAIPLGGNLDPAALSSGASVASGVSQWSLTAGVEKTLVTRPTGASVGVTGDVLIPFAVETAGIGDPRTTILKSPTVRFGTVVRW